MNRVFVVQQFFLGSWDDLLLTKSYPKAKSTMIKIKKDTEGRRVRILMRTEEVLLDWDEFILSQINGNTEKGK